VSVKERAIRAIQELPEDADHQAVSEKLEFVRAVDEGLDQAKAGKVISSEEMRKRLSKWLSE
jgi:predicted transcriptional regulator